MTQEEKDKVLNNWAALNEQLMKMDEKEVKDLLDRETKGRARARVMLRVYNRYSKLRGTREKAELMAKAKG